MAESEECGTSELDLFCLPPTQVAIEDSKWLSVNPREVNDGYSIKFEFTANDGLYLDLAKSYISFKVKIDGTTDQLNKAGPVNNTAHSLFKQIDVEINGQVVTPSSPFYPYVAMIMTLLGYGKEAAITQLALSGYSKDTAGHMDVVDLVGANKGLKARSEGFNAGQWRDYIMRPNVAIFQQERLLPPSTKVCLNLIPSEPKFCLMADGATGTYKPKLKDLKLHARMVKVNPAVALEQARKRTEQGLNLYYPIRRLKPKAVTMARGVQSHTEIISTGQKPKKVYVGLLGESNLLGHFSKNPFNFKNYDLNQIHLSSGLRNYPTTPLTPDYTNGMYRESYMTLFSSQGILFDDKGLDISLADYKDGYAIYAFDLSADQNDGDHLELVKRCDIQLHLKFGTALPESVTILIFAEYENTIQIDPFNTVIKDYMN